MADSKPQDQSRASQLEDAMTKRLRQQRNPFLKPVFAVAAIGTLFLIFMLIMQMMADAEKTVGAAPAEKTHLTVHGECICICCTLGLSTQHHRAVRYLADASEPRIILLRDNPEKDMNLDYFCGGPTPVLVEGDVLNTNGFRILQATAFKAFPEER